MPQIDPLNSSCSQKLQFHKKLKAISTLKEEFSLEKVVAPKVTLANANAYNCSSKKFTALNE